MANRHINVDFGAVATKFLSRNICFEFSVLSLCVVVPKNKQICKAGTKTLFLPDPRTSRTNGYVLGQ
jgi:hypothetical protein